MDDEAEPKATALSKAEGGPRKRRKGWPIPVLWLAFVLMYGFKPDWATAIWYWPAWIWASLIVMLALPSLAFRRLKWFGAMLVLSLVFALCFDDMPRGVIRSWWRAIVSGPPLAARPFEVVSVNCAGGSIDAAREALDSGADLALLQESPGRAELEKLVNERWGSEGSVIAGPDCSIVAKGQLWTVGFTNRPNFAWAQWTTSKGQQWIVLSLRLQPPTFRLDYWNPGCWRAYADDRARRKKELDEIIGVLRDLALSPDANPIIGGDFNGPPSECFQDSLQALCTDSYAYEGRGWGGTGTNDYPFVRFDQIWVRPERNIVNAGVEKTGHSDHRMAVAWVEGRSAPD
ncbi:MAG: hypothetical protein HZC36_13710 [Armatimonadetes bacterium]|nr:hypothetical protein [Armatimonadota bacterium]